MEDFTEKTCREFVVNLASSDPVPGGGGAAALAGAVGCALGNMVGSLTVGKKKYADVEAEILALKEECDRLQSNLLDQVKADAEAFSPLAEAYRIPKDRPDRADVLEKATLEACSAPLRIVELCAEAMDKVRVMAEKGSKMALSDAGCAAVILKGAAEAASLNVYVNTCSLRDREAAERLDNRCEELLNAACREADDIYAAVRKRFGRS